MYFFSSDYLRGIDNLCQETFKNVYNLHEYLLVFCTFICTMHIALYLMLWQQIKLTTYDFSDLQITGECDNTSFKTNSCVDTYLTGADRRLLMFIYIKFSQVK